MTENKTPKFLAVAEGEHGLLFNLGNGKSITFDVSKCTADVQEKAMYHGFKQKIADSVAGLSKEQKYSEAFAELSDVIATLYGGEWNRRASGTGGQVVADLAAALAKLKKVDYEKAFAAVQKADDETRKAWMKAPAIKGAIAEIVSARLKAAAKADTSDILDSIEL